jgi:ribosome-associated protein
LEKNSTSGRKGRTSERPGKRGKAAARDEREPEQFGGSERARLLALAVAAAGLEKKATGVEIIDVYGKVDYTEFLVLMSGRSDRHVHAIARGVEDDLRKQGDPPLSVEGLTSSMWVLLDFNDVVVHVFQQQARTYYDLEGLWIDAGRVSLPETERARRGGVSGRPSTPPKE